MPSPIAAGRLLLGSVAVTALALVTSCAPATPAPTAGGGTPEVGEISVTMYRQASSVPAVLAMEQGFDRDAGVDLAVDWGESSQAILAALVGGGADVGTVSIPSIVEASREGFDIRIVGEAFREVEGSQLLETLPGSGIDGIDDLAGKTVGVVGLLSGHDTRLRYVMGLEGIDESATTFVSVSFGEMGVALETGQIDAGVFTGPTLKQAKDALDTRTIFDFGAGPLEGYPAMQWVMMGDFVDANPAAVAAFQCAVVVRGAEAADDEAAFRDAMIDGLGFSPEGFAAVVKPDYPAANDPKVMQRAADIFFEVGVITEAFDVSEITVPLPGSCD